MSENSFDYVIVGAGSAGCVLANRLTQDPSIRVLLLEAGGHDRHPLLRMPIAWTMVSTDRRFDWGYTTEPEPQLGGRRVILPRGKVVGGSSSVNAMRYSRGHPADYDQWKQMGLQGWGYEDVLPYFKRSERSWRGEGRYHGGQGELRVHESPVDKETYSPLATAAKAAGYAETADIHGDVTEGVIRTELTIDDRSRRHSTARAFLRTALKRPTLTMVTRALTTRIRIENGRAAGVDYRHGGALIQAHATREVILSGGSYNSPQLLMLSGIGPADELRAHGITVVLDQPNVGRNLAEHPILPVVMTDKGASAFMRHLRMDRAALAAMRWFFTGRGPFSINGNTAGVFLRTRPELDRPDVQLIFAATSRDAKLWWPHQPAVFSVQCSISIQNPQARGVVTLRSADPADAPRIRLNLFGEQSDIDTAVRAIRIAREIYGHKAMSGLVGEELLPGKAAQTDEQLAEHVRATASTTQHPCGTCRMGADAGSVVDQNLRLRGIAGLRVVDASVMPTLTVGHINAPVIMIAEKAADMIKADQAVGGRAAA